MIDNLVKIVLENGGSIKPLIIPSELTNGYGLCNATIFNDNGNLIVNIRNVRYTLHHNESTKKFQSAWSGPLQYLHPENDRTLTTNNFLCKINPESLDIESFEKVDTTELDVPPLWDFVGLEDARLVKWDDKMFMCGVRRDTTTNGEGRMELSEIVNGKEVSRNRINIPKSSPYLYCEKNWMPILDLPYHFIKWSNPLEIIKINLEDNSSEFIFIGEKTQLPNHLRGGSQVITIGDYRVTLTHEVHFPYNPQKHKDAVYQHKLIVWDKDWNLVSSSDEFNFMSALIEFSCGMCVFNDKVLITYGFQDNSAFLLELPMTFFKKLCNIDQKFKNFDWGILKDNTWFYERLQEEFVLGDIYQKFFKVNEGDVVLDVGASVGPFTHSILENNPKGVYCIEPQRTLYETLTNNFINNKNVICHNTAIFDIDGVEDVTGVYNPGGYLTGDSIQESNVTKFSTFINDNGIKNIDFLKLDCEGGEYDIFNSENYEWILNNVKKIVGEFHLSGNILKEKFRTFRDTYLTVFKNVKVISIDDVDIKWDLFNENFIERYSEVMIYIDNTDEIITKKNNLNPKLTGFPTVNCITLEDSHQRQEDIRNQATRLGLEKLKMVRAYDGRIVNYKDNPIVSGSHFNEMTSGDIATVMSHLQTIQEWYLETNEEYGFFCEDDIMLTNSDNWNFTWTEFVSKLPKNWNAIQLSLIRNIENKFSDDTFKFEQRTWGNFSASSYILSRKYAKVLLEKFHPNEYFNFKIILTTDQSLRPMIENVIYAINDPNIYTVPIFVENTSVPSTFYPIFIDTQHKQAQYESAEYATNWWTKNKNIDQLDLFFKPKKEYWRITEYPTMEFTTSIPPKGCVVDCTFCPQRTLVDIYKGENMMTLEIFKMSVSKLPKEVRVSFSGFTEPWLNPNCTDMLIYAHEQGHPVSVFTTGIGMTLDDVRRIKNIPFTEGPNGGFCLHLPDEEYIAKHPITNRYIEVLEYFKEVQHEIQGFYLMSMGEVKKDLQYIFPTAHVPEMWSRAGNLLGEAIIKPELYEIRQRFKHMYHGKEDMTCGCVEDLYHNVVLPNGDVSLCCMDYGLKHIIGNIFRDNYDDIIPKPNSCFDLCRKCENGIKPKKKLI